MPEEPGFCRIAAERAELPPIAARATFYWDGMETVSPLLGLQTGTEPDTPDLPLARPLTLASRRARRRTATGQHARLSLTVGEIGLACSSPSSTVDWEREAASLTFFLDPGLLMTAARDIVPGVVGELLWVCHGGGAQPTTLYVHPVLLVRATHESLQTDRVEIVLHLRAGDPLLRHITLVLQGAIYGEDMTGRLYSESIIYALAVHFLRRYAACRPPAEVCRGEPSTPHLQRVMEYIEAHLERRLLLTQIAAVAQMSPDHFARQFRQATGLTPHQYVVICRIERAKRLLRDTEWPIIDISRQVGFTDQSYFTAVFRKHVATTPKAYRDSAHR
jgi:AraC-like DNA-binding protein